MSLFSKIFKKRPKTAAPKGISLKEALRNKYLTFQNLLNKNNHVLELMAEMEEKLSGEYLFDRQFIHTHARQISDGVLNIIQYLNVLSDNKYTQLHAAYTAIREEIESTLTFTHEIPVSELVIPIENLAKEMSSIAGGKIAHLGEMRSRLNLPTPDGFAVSSYAFKRFMEHNRFSEKINEHLSAMDVHNLEGLNETSRKIQQMVIAAEIPADLKNAIQQAVDNLSSLIPRLPSSAPIGGPSSLMVSVRSSAIQEDGEFSFAGQYATFLNVPESEVVQKYKEVVASLFTPRAIFYYKTKGFSEEEMVMAVGVLRMVDAKAGGVMYTRDPNDPEKDVVIINALWGLGKAVVDGEANPHSFFISREGGTILENRITEQHDMLVCSAAGDIQSVAVPDEKRMRACLTVGELTTLLNHAVALENHYKRPQDIEWAIDRDDRIYILQSRPLRTFKIQDSKFKIPRKVEGRTILIDKGVIACKGIGYGKAYVLKDDEDLKDFPEGAVLVARHTSTKYVTVMDKASAIITDVGGATGHMASLAREYGIPAILDTETGTSVIRHGQDITVDAMNCNVYAGRVDELLEYASIKKEPFRDTHLFTVLEKATKWIVPLNLIDPDRENFKPESCKTFHDITRFAHEMAMAEIFKTGKGQETDTFEDLMSAITLAEEGEAKRLGEQTSALKAGIPVDAHLLDIDGGIRSDLKKVTPGDITSVPFSAFLKGMMNMKWPEPRPADVKGFMGMIAHTASIPEEELRKTGSRSYAIVSGNYMNFSIRLGYHFSMVEAYAGENMNDNYIKFFFKGGGAARDRRLRRVRLITEILKKIDFRVNVTEDVIDAILTKYKQQAVEQKLTIMGKLTAYTKQLDMALYNEAVADMFIEDFVTQHISPSVAS